MNISQVRFVLPASVEYRIPSDRSVQPSNIRSLKEPLGEFRSRRVPCFPWSYSPYVNPSVLERTQSPWRMAGQSRKRDLLRQGSFKLRRSPNDLWRPALPGSALLTVETKLLSAIALDS